MQLRDSQLERTKSESDPKVTSSSTEYDGSNNVRKFVLWQRRFGKKLRHLDSFAAPIRKISTDVFSGASLRVGSSPGDSLERAAARPWAAASPATARVPSRPRAAAEGCRETTRAGATAARPARLPPAAHCLRRLAIGTNGTA